MTESLPALIDRAGQRLIGAKTSAEVLEAKHIAESALHYARVTQAANETHADCLRIITRAEMRMANEIDAGQASGEISTGGKPSGETTVSDLGVRRDQLHNWRTVRDAGEEMVNGVIAAALDEGRAPTKAEVLKAAKEIRAEAQGEKAGRRDEKMRKLAHASRQASERLGVQQYNVILADPPWRFEVQSRETGMDRSADNHYPTMTTGELFELDVSAAAARNCALFLWATAPHLSLAIDLMDHWGFVYKSNLVWDKMRDGTGYWFRNAHEHLLVGTRGNIPAPLPGTQPSSVLEVEATRHSEKPARVYEIIENMFPTVPKLEMFARAQRHGWDQWGNET